MEVSPSKSAQNGQKMPRVANLKKIYLKRFWDTLYSLGQICVLQMRNTSTQTREINIMQKQISIERIEHGATPS